MIPVLIETLKPSKGPVCKKCRVPLRPVWVKQGSEPQLGLKCKCGTILYEAPQNSTLDTFRGSENAQDRDLLTHILDIIRELEREFNEPIDESLIMQRAYEEDISELETSGALNRLKQDGQIYDPNRNQKYKVV